MESILTGSIFFRGAFCFGEHFEGSILFRGAFFGEHFTGSIWRGAFVRRASDPESSANDRSVFFGGKPLELMS